MLRYCHMSYSSVTKRITFPDNRGAATSEIEIAPRTYNPTYEKSTILFLLGRLDLGLVGISLGIFVQFEFCQFFVVIKGSSINKFNVSDGIH